jgi:drug/metabolite transporter (DMT)-like permease
VICLVLLVFFIGIGVYYIKLATQDDNGSDLTDFGIDILNEYIVEILLCIGASICLGIIYTFLLKLASKLIIYFMITATLAVLVYLIFLSLIGQEYMISLILVLPTILYCVIMICYR